MVCFFIGHKDATESIMPLLEAAVCKHITEYGVTEFFVGQYGAFDRMAAQAVVKAKREFPAVRLTILCPFHPAERDVKAPEGYDSTFYPPGLETVPKRFAIARANQYMIRHCDYLIAHAWQPGSNSLRLLKQAQRSGVHTTNLTTFN